MGLSARNNKRKNHSRVNRLRRKKRIHAKKPRNPASPREVAALEWLRGVVFTKEMSCGTCRKLTRLATSESDDQNERWEFWRQVSVYTGQTASELYFEQDNNKQETD